jgi:phosphohistidine phosphatase
MKTLYLIRHAKSDWAIATLADIDRPLNTRGYTDAHKMSAALKSTKIIPDLIITSPAVRAISTALIFARNLNYNAALINIQPTLYHTNAEQYLEIISQTDSKINTLFLFGHNPIITNCANSLIKNNIENIPTCGIVAITNDCEDWEKFVSADGKLLAFDFPKKT